MKKLLVVFASILLMLSLVACYSTANNGKTPYIQNGYWYVDGVNTGVKAEGVDGKDGQDGQDGTNGTDGETPTIEISEDGYWVINGVNTGVKAEGVDGEDGKDGQDGTNGTDGKDGQDGTNGTDGKDGQDGQDGTNGTDGETPTIEISEDGYWVINGEKTSYRADEDSWCKHNYVEVGIIGNACEKHNVLMRCDVCGKLEVEAEDAIKEHNYINEICIACGDIKPSDGLELRLSDDKTYYEIAGIGRCSDADLVLPSIYNGLPVTRICNKAFYDCDNLTSVIISDSVTSISDWAFSCCDNLTSVIIGDSVTSIGDYAFRYCDSLTSVIIPDSVTSIGYEAFAGCNLTSISVSDNNPAYKSIDGNLYSKDGTTLVQYAIGKEETSFSIPTGVTTIADNAFMYCNLTSVEIGNDVASIGAYAFYNSMELTNLFIGKNVTTIGIFAFYHSPNLTNVYITDIGAWCNIDFEQDNANPLAYYTNLFLNNTLVTELVIPNTVTIIKPWVFRNCGSITNVVIPYSVKTIGNGAFRNCPKLIEFKVWEGHNKFSSIDGNLYNNAGTTLIQYANGKSSTEFTIPNSVTSISDLAFFGCDNLTSVTLGNGVTSIGDDAFWGCDNLIEVINKSALDIAVGSNSYGGVAENAIEVHNGESKVINQNEYFFYTYNGTNYLFAYLGDATELILPDSCNGENYVIYQNAFDSCDNLTSVIIGDSVTSIGNYAFMYCDNLTSVIIGDSVASIGDNAFYGCHSLTSVIIPDSVTNIGNYAFSGCDNLTSVTLGDSVTSIGYHAFYRCDSLTSIIIPDSVTSIAHEAFSYCDNLTIYCEAESMPSGWAGNWNSSNRPVVWGYNG